MFGCYVLFFSYVFTCVFCVILHHSEVVRCIGHRSTLKKALSDSFLSRFCVTGACCQPNRPSKAMHPGRLLWRHPGTLRVLQAGWPGVQSSGGHQVQHHPCLTGGTAAHQGMCSAECVSFTAITLPLHVHTLLNLTLSSISCRNIIYDINMY